MKPEYFQDIIERIDVEYYRVRHFQVDESVFVHEYQDRADTILIANDTSTISYGLRRPHLSRGGGLYIPSGYKVPLRFGQGKRQQVEVANRSVFQEKYFSISGLTNTKSNFTMISLDVRILSTFNLFNTLNIPAFLIQNNPMIMRTAKEMLRERVHETDGFRKVLDLLSCRFVIEVMRYLHHNELFTDKFEDDTLQIKDSRLLNVLSYINNNLDKDLSNVVLADVSNLSEEYFGQMFKRLMKGNVQQFIENRRMQRSVELLRETNLTIGEISKEVGYADMGYFCRRFKNYFDVSTTEFKKQEAGSF